MPGDLLDLILLALIAAFAVAGYRQGFIIGVLSLVGFLGGVALGALIAPRIARALASSLPVQAFIAILVVFIAAIIGMLVASGIGVAVRSRLTARPATVLDSIGGAAVNVLAVLVVAWMMGTFLVNSQFGALSGQVNNSVVLRTVDRVMPRAPLDLPIFPQFRTLLSNGLYEQVFNSIGAASSLTLPPASPAILDSAALARVKPSIVEIKGGAPSCGLDIEGSGFVIAPQHVLTNAHVVAGVTQGPDVYAANGQMYHARVVLFDPQIDVAVLYVPGLTARPLRFAGAAAYDTSAIVAGYPEEHPLTLRPAKIGHSFEANGANIYNNRDVTRQIYAIRADIEPGNSGGPLLSTTGRVYGVVFAASTSYTDTGYALTAAEVAQDAARGSRSYSAVSTEACQAG